MNENKPVLETDVYFHDVQFFGDDEEHYYDVECHDGYAMAKKCNDDDSGPAELMVTYPKREAIINDEAKVDALLDYRGLTGLSANDITFGDIMLFYGKLKTK